MICILTCNTIDTAYCSDGAHYEMIITPPHLFFLQIISEASFYSNAFALLRSNSDIEQMEIRHPEVFSWCPSCSELEEYSQLMDSTLAPPPLYLVHNYSHSYVVHWNKSPEAGSTANRHRNGSNVHSPAAPRVQHRPVHVSGPSKQR